jgi:hypothetical protein
VKNVSMIDVQVSSVVRINGIRLKIDYERLDSLG